MQIGDNLHEMLKSVFWGKIKKYFNMSSAENFTENAKSNDLAINWQETAVAIVFVTNFFLESVTHVL